MNERVARNSKFRGSAAMTASSRALGCFPAQSSIRHSALPTEATPQTSRRRGLSRSLCIACLVGLMSGIVLLLWCYHATASIRSGCAVHGVCELRFRAWLPNPFEISFHGIFVCERLSQRDGGQASSCEQRDGETIVRGFYDGGGEFVLRFSPPSAGTWSYVTNASAAKLHELRGAISATSTHVWRGGEGSRGPAAASGRGFRFADGTEFLPIGTTAYAWAHQDASRREATLRTLAGRGRVFNKMRFTVFPKWYTYNQEEPPSGLYPYTGSPPANWDFRSFDPRFWRHFEALVGKLLAQGVVADIILFHPYDHGHWGFDCMGGLDPETYNVSNDIHFIRYVVARLGAYSNVWWSMANEWDFVKCKAKGLPNETRCGQDVQAGPSATWDELFKALTA